jgi:fimbrial isopeptide formation D2 family protein/LPXTG-motif cell wall-anchored protein
VVDDSTLGTDDAASAIVLNVVGNTSVTEKVSKPGVDKEVENASGTYNTVYADHAINESFNFRLTATLPADTDYAAYDHYKVVFTDTPSIGITYESIGSVVITGKTSAGADVSKTVTPYDASTNANGYKLSGDLTGSSAGAADGNGTKTLVVTIEDLKKTEPTIDLTKGATVTVIYSAHLNANADVEPLAATADETTNKNTVKLTYSNNPSTNGTGDTHTDDVYVFTFELDNNKWAGPGTKVADPANVTISGSETLATTTKTQWEDKTNHKFYVKSGSDWYVMDPLAGAGFTLYDSTKTTAIKLINNNDGTYTVANQDAASGYVTEMTSASGSGKFDVKGLDIGTYILSETTTPPGYNTAADITVTISATYDTTNKVNVTVTSTNDDNDIVDNSGTQLPSTGGIGTTIFYIVGGLLLVGAAVILVARRKAHD